MGWAWRGCRRGMREVKGGYQFQGVRRTDLFDNCAVLACQKVVEICVRAFSTILNGSSADQFVHETIYCPIESRLRDLWVLYPIQICTTKNVLRRDFCDFVLSSRKIKVHVKQTENCTSKKTPTVVFSSWTFCSLLCLRCPTIWETDGSIVVLWPCGAVSSSSQLYMSRQCEVIQIVTRISRNLYIVFIVFLLRFFGANKIPKKTFST